MEKCQDNFPDFLGFEAGLPASPAKNGRGKPLEWLVAIFPKITGLKVLVSEMTPNS
jgi:hypothetical protein